MIFAGPELEVHQSVNIMSTICKEEYKLYRKGSLWHINAVQRASLFFSLYICKVLLYVAVSISHSVHFGVLEVHEFSELIYICASCVVFGLIISRLQVDGVGGSNGARGAKIYTTLNWALA